MSRGPALECEDLLSGFEPVGTGGRAPDADLKSCLRGCERARIVEVWSATTGSLRPAMSR